MRKLGYSSVEITDEKPEYGHHVEVMMMKMSLDDLKSKLSL